jgi:hypothetical protein
MSDDDAAERPRVRIQQDQMQRRSSVGKREKKPPIRYMRDQHAQVHKKQRMF